MIEQHAAAHGERAAVQDATQSMTYRELNQRANAVGRRLMNDGFRRGMQGHVTAPVGADLAVLLLGVLKAGGCYAWTDCERSPGDPLVVGFDAGQTVSEARQLVVDMSSLVRGPASSHPNLPILVRGEDVACVLACRESASTVGVPHHTITSLVPQLLPGPSKWEVGPGALGLWLVLTMGGTLSITHDFENVAA